MAHLRRCHLTKENITESELTLQRAGYFGKTAQQGEKMFVCPIHRATLGKDWVIQLAAQNADIQSIRENRLVPVKSCRVSGSDGKNCRQPRNFQNLLVVSANSRLADGRLQKLRGGGTRFSEKVKSYLTARFDVDTQTGRKPDLSEVATDMRTTRNTGSSRTFQRRMAYKGTSSIILFQTVCNQQEKKG